MAITPPTITVDLATFRRLLLAKELYQHAYEHSRLPGAFNKMVAVHNFHNAIEITLRSLCLHYQIYEEKGGDATFNDILSRIIQCFKTSNIDPLPYAQQIRQLNQARNQVQHHAFEPPDSAIDEWRVFTRSFLVDVFNAHFQANFESLSSIDLIANPELRQLMALSLSNLLAHNVRDSLAPLIFAFECASTALREALPSSSADMTWVTGRDEVERAFAEYRRDIEDWAIKVVQNAELLAINLAAGIALEDYLRYQAFRDQSPVYLSVNGESTADERDTLPPESEARWAHEFVTNMILRWQDMRLIPAKQPDWEIGCEKIMTRRGIPPTLRLGDGKVKHLDKPCESAPDP